MVKKNWDKKELSEFLTLFPAPPKNKQTKKGAKGLREIFSEND